MANTSDAITFWAIERASSSITHSPGRDTQQPKQPVHGLIAQVANHDPLDVVPSAAQSSGQRVGGPRGADIAGCSRIE